jgi:hypothetical protein
MYRKLKGPKIIAAAMLMFAASVLNAQDAKVLDAKVWVNVKTKTYHCPGSRWYGRTAKGIYALESAAIEAGVRPTGGKTCAEQATKGVDADLSHIALPAEEQPAKPVKGK